MAEVMIPPWVRPESPETIRVIDDATVAFQPAFGRGMTQRGIWADPRWGLRRRYRGLRSDEKAAIFNALNESRGQLNTLRVTPHTPLRGSMTSTELLANNTFSNGTTGWSSDSQYSVSVSDRVARTTRAASGTGIALESTSSVTLVQYAPYVFRAMLLSGRGSYGSTLSMRLGSTMGNAEHGGESTGRSYTGLQTMSRVALSTTGYVALADNSSSGLLAGDYFSTPYVSLQRCVNVDTGLNQLVRSDELDHASWTRTGLSSISTAETDPLGTTTAEAMVENSSTSQHCVTQAVTVSTSALDYSFAVAIKTNGRNFAFLQMIEGTGGTDVYRVFDIVNGTLGTSNATGANWSNLRSYISPLGNGWYYCVIVARKTNAATTITCAIQIASTDGAGTYLGNGSSGLRAWRATLAQSSLPTQLSQTTSALNAGTLPTGNAMYTKGWPVSTSGLMLAGDWFEISGELKQLTAPVNSNAAGLAYVQFRPGLSGTIVDNEPLILYEPFGRFIYPAGTREFENLFGIYGDCEMNLEEVYA